MSGWSVFWAGLKGFFTPGSSAFVGIVGLAFDSANSALAGTVTLERLMKAVAVLKKVLDILYSYESWCPAKWLEEFVAARRVLAKLVSVLEDGRVELDEAKALVTEFKLAYAEWNAD